MIYERYQRADPVVLNKKIFDAHPNIAEFAKVQPLPKDEEIIA